MQEEAPLKESYRPIPTLVEGETYVDDDITYVNPKVNRPCDEHTYGEPEKYVDGFVMRTCACGKGIIERK